MKKRWIVLGAVVVIVAAVIAVAALNVDAWLDENHEMIEEEIAAAIGRPVDIADLGVQLWGGFGVRIEGLVIGEDPSYGEAPFLTLDEGVLRVSILPALFGRVEIGEIVLASPDIRLIRDDRGLSVETMIPADDEAAPEPEEEEASLDLTISSLRIVDGRIVFEDRTGAEVVEAVIDHVDLAVDDIGPSTPLHFTLAASLLGAESPNLNGEGTAGPVLGAGDAPLSFDVRFTLDALSLADVARLEDVAAALPEGTRLGGTLDARLAASGVPDDVAFDVAVDAADADLELGTDLVKKPGTAMSFEAKGSAKTDAAVVDAFAFTLAGARFDGRATAALDERGAWDATIRGQDVPLGGWGELLPAAAGLPVEGRLGLDVRARGRSGSERLPALDGTVTLADVAVRMADTPPVEKLAARLGLKGAAAELRDTRFELGGAPMQLEADIADLNAPEVRFALDAPVLPLAAVGVVEPGTEADDQLRALRAVGEADLRSDDLVADVRFASPQGRLQSIDYTELEGRASVAGARMQLDELNLKLLGGAASITGALDETDPGSPSFEGSVDLAGVKAGEIAKVYFPAAGDVVSGRIYTKLALGAQGLDTDALLRSLMGEGRIDVRDGELIDVNLAEEVLRGATGVPGLSTWISPTVKERHPNVFSTGNTVFRRLGADVKIEEGKLRTDDLQLDTAEFGLTGGGTLGLDGRLDLKTEFTSSAALATSLVGVANPTRYLLDRSGRLVVPVRITGDVTSPKVAVDEKYLGQALKKAAVGSATSALEGLLRPSRREGASSDAPTDAPTEAPSEEAAPDTSSDATDEADAPPPSLEEEVQRGLDGLLGR